MRNICWSLLMGCAALAGCRLTPFENGQPDGPTVTAIGRVLVGEKPAEVARDLAQERAVETVSTPRARGGGPVGTETIAPATASTPAASTPPATVDITPRPASAPPPAGTATNPPASDANAAPATATGTAPSETAATTTPAPSAPVTPGEEPWRNTGATGTPVGATTPPEVPPDTSAATAQQPVREPAYSLQRMDATTRITPPSHPGLQPLLIAFDESCDDGAPVCPVPDEMARGYGWSVCTKTRSNCDVPPTQEQRSYPDDSEATIHRLEADHQGAVTRADSIVIAKGPHALALLGDQTPAGSRYTLALLVDPGASDRITLAPTLPFHRIAWIEPARAGARQAMPQLAEDLTARGVALAWFETANDDDAARRDALQHAVAWLRAGDDARVCPEVPPQGHADRALRVTCNRLVGAGPTGP